MSVADESGLSASQALLSAALGGLLCVASAACGGVVTSGSAGSEARGGEPSTTASGSSSSESSDAASGGIVNMVAAVANGDTPIPDEGCATGVSPTPRVTSSMVVANMTLALFTTQCDALNGIFELQPNCSGSNACRGMSYDSATQVMVQHTCRGMNSCAGYSCVVCD